MLADSHLHFFSPGFAESLPGSCRRVKPSELELYEALRNKWDVQAVLAVGYEGSEAYNGNNDYIAQIAQNRPWVYPLAFVRPADFNLQRLQGLASRGFAGLSMYPSDAEAAQLPAVADEVWAWLIQQKAIISVNAKAGAEAWPAWDMVLRRHPQLGLLVSHLGLPGKWAAVPTVQAAKDRLANVLALAAYPNVQVKFSAFYAVSDPYYDYPHTQAYPFMEVLLESFGVKRLLWGSDFAPVLEYVSFQQTFAALEKWPKLTGADLQAVKSGNLLSLLEQGAMGRKA